MQLSVILVILGSILQIGGAASYIKDTWVGTTKPNRMSWALWAIAPMIGTGIALSQDGGWAALPVFINGFCPFLILIASFANQNAYWRLNKLDYACGALSLVALVLWLGTQQPVLALVFAIASDALAAVPTVIKAWQYPETESAMVYAFSFINALTAFFVIPAWSFVYVGFPLYLLVQNGSTLAGIVRDKLRAGA